jgi:hypothetical protein
VLARQQLSPQYQCSVEWLSSLISLWWLPWFQGNELYVTEQQEIRKLCFPGTVIVELLSLSFSMTGNGINAHLFGEEVY